MHRTGNHVRNDGFREMIVVPFEPWHLDFIKPLWPVFTDKIALERSSISFTAVDYGKPLAIAGIIPLWKGVAESYMIPSALFPNHKIQCIKYIKLNQEFLRRELKLHRLQTTVPSDFSAAIRWLEWLGYERESTLRQWGPDQKDHYRYVRFFDGC
jgi:hypothetical protein